MSAWDIFFYFDEASSSVPIQHNKQCGPKYRIYVFSFLYHTVKEYARSHYLTPNTSSMHNQTPVSDQDNDYPFLLM